MINLSCYKGAAPALKSVMIIMIKTHRCVRPHMHAHTDTPYDYRLYHPTSPTHTVLGMGFVWGILFFGNHVIMEWLWMMARLVESVEVHSGYDFPYFNPMHLIPGYAGTLVSLRKKIELR